MSYYAPKTELPSNPISWADIKYWLRLDDDSERDKLVALAGDLLAWAEDHCNSTIVQRARTITHYARVCRYELPYGPVNSVTTVKDANNDDVAYEIERAGTATYVKLTQGTSHYPLTITYNAGYAALPDIIKRAVLIGVETMHRNRGGEIDLSGVKTLLATRGYGTWVA